MPPANSAKSSSSVTITVADSYCKTTDDADKANTETNGNDNTFNIKNCKKDTNRVIEEQLDSRKRALLQSRLIGVGGIPSSFPPSSVTGTAPASGAVCTNISAAAVATGASVTPAKEGTQKNHRKEGEGEGEEQGRGESDHYEAASNLNFSIEAEKNQHHNSLNCNNCHSHGSGNQNHNHNSNIHSNSTTTMDVNNNNENSNSLGGASTTSIHGGASALSHVSGSASQASCQTLLTSHVGFKADGVKSGNASSGNSSGTNQNTETKEMTTPPKSSRKKNTPIKRPQSSIGQPRQTTPTTSAKKQKTKKDSSHSPKYAATSSNIDSTSRDSTSTLILAQPPLSAASSSSRDRFFSPGASNPVPSLRGAKNSSATASVAATNTPIPPTTATSSAATGTSTSIPNATSSNNESAQIKSHKTSKQKSINSFFGGGSGKKKSDLSKSSDYDKKPIENNDSVVAQAALSPTKSTKKPRSAPKHPQPQPQSQSQPQAQMQTQTQILPTPQQSQETNNQNQPQYHLSDNINNNNTDINHQQLLTENQKLKHQNQDLQQKLQESLSENAAIKNSQNLRYHSLSKRMKDSTAEMEKKMKEYQTQSFKARQVIEELVRKECEREAKELRQKLASDGARLGRLVSSMVGVGSRVKSGKVVENWEDGHASMVLKERREDLRRRRAELERREREWRRRFESAGGGVGGVGIVSIGDCSAGSSVLSAEHTTVLSMDSGDDSSSRRLLEVDEFEISENMANIRRHLDEIRKQEAELDIEERELKIQKQSHIRALRLVANEDSSKFKKTAKLNDRYVLMNLLGKGGFSEVWRAYDLEKLRHVAVKIHQLQSSWSDSKKENFLKHITREYEIHRSVRHPRVVSFYGIIDLDADSFATVLECCVGTDLDTVLRDRGKLPELEARAILLQILSGMKYLSTPSLDGERQGVIHYDLKPANIIFDENGDAKITDFGLSKIVENQDEEGMELTSFGAGTYWYLPPECFMEDDGVRISNKVDVWSIGVIFYQMLFGRRPFGDGVSQDNMFLNRTMLDATEVNFPSKPTISDEARSFIQACLTYDQLHRPNISQICEHRYVKLRTDNSFGN